MNEVAQAFSIPRLLSEDDIRVFFLVTVFLGGSAAWLTGRAAAQTWRPLWQVAVYALILALAVRFIHFSLFSGTLLSLHYYLIDAAVCLVLGLLGFRAARARQMVGQYSWINEPNGPLRWRRQMR